MLVSNFELLIKRIATLPSTTPSSLLKPFRRVVQGYFLLISNLDNSRSINLSLKMTIPTADGNREMNSSNTNCFFDNGASDNLPLSINRIAGNSNSNSTEYRTSAFSLGPKQTGLLAVLPLVNNFLTIQNPDLEIRGYSELVQTHRRIWDFFSGAPSVDVLVNPEIRGTFLDDAYPTIDNNDELDFDQIAYSLLTSSGKTKNRVKGIRPLIFIKNDPLNLERIRVINPLLEDSEVKMIFELTNKLSDNLDFQKIIRSSEDKKM